MTTATRSRKDERPVILQPRLRAAYIASLPERLRRQFYDSLTDTEKLALNYAWRFWARPEQILPDGEDWATWLILAGRGWGKTRTGAEAVQDWVKQGYKRIALVARTAADARDVMIEGESGILATSPPWFRPKYYPSKRRLEWPNGAIATSYSSDEPSTLRGPQHEKAWVDELASWRYMETWDQLQFGLRLGNNPQVVITTTPRPIPVLRELIAEHKLGTGTVAIARGTTYDNRANLAPRFFDTIIKKYEGSRLGRQELSAEILDDNPNALWKRTNIDSLRLGPGQVTQFENVVVAVDPSVHDGEVLDLESEKRAECGIVVVGKLTINGVSHAYVIDDLSLWGSPAEWANEVVKAYKTYAADLAVAEQNNGGALVEMVIQAIDPRVTVQRVTAARGKRTRAEPVSALYEQRRVHHLGSFAKLEDQMCEWIPGEPSPDRMDALVWGVTHLLLSDDYEPTISAKWA